MQHTNVVRYDLTEHCLTIYDAYKTHKRDMRPDLKGIRKATQGETTSVWERSIFSLKMEWICHKFLYKIGYQRERTKNADLDNPCDRSEWKYIVCGLLVWPFVW